MFSFFAAGGPWMLPILAVSIVALALILERSYVLWVRYRIDSEQFLNRLVGEVESKNISRAIELCNVEERHPLAAVLKAGLMRAHESDRDIQRALETATLSVAPEVSKRVGYLAMLANVATLLGLLGTIMGLIDCFEAVKTADAAAKQDALSAGIAVAMLTTAFGLISAIPSIIAHSVLNDRLNAVLSVIETRATELFNYLSARNRKLRQG